MQVVGLDYRWLAINNAAAGEFERIFGVRPKTGDNMLELLANQPELQRDVKAVWTRALTGEEFTEIAEFGDPARDRRFYEMRFNALRDREGTQIGAYQAALGALANSRQIDIVLSDIMMPGGGVNVLNQSNA